MIYFILGIIIGILLTLTVFVSTLRLKTPIERTIRQCESRVSPKGNILETETREVEEWVKSLEQ